MDQSSILSLLSTRNTTLTNNTRVRSLHLPTMIPMDPENITRWNDFNLININNAYGDLLSKPSNIVLGQGDDKHFGNQSELRNYAFDPLISTLRPLVSESARVLGQRLGFAPTIDWHQDVPLAGPQVVGNALRPSLTIFFATTPRTSLVTSMVYVSSAWCSTDIETDGRESTWPVQHLAKYAQHSGNRYMR